MFFDVSLSIKYPDPKHNFEQMILLKIIALANELSMNAFSPSCNDELFAFLVSFVPSMMDPPEPDCGSEMQNL